MEDNKTKSLFTQEITSMPEKENQIRCMGCMEVFDEEFELCPNCGYVVGTAPKMKSYLRPGTPLSGDYMLGRVIGQGGFGITYIAWDKRENRKVAVKEFFPSALSTREDGETHVVCYNGKAEQYFKEGVKKMLDEGNRLSRFKDNPNIVNVYDYFEENGTAYIVMEYLDGKNLKEYAEENGGRIDPREAVNLMMPVIAALEEMHGENMIHRDIAPDNIYLCEDGKIKLLDFGSARIAVQDAEKSLSVMVKPGYAPKEQYASRSKQGPWTDVYSVCATIYKLITGESPVESIERENTPLKTFESFGIMGYNDIQDILFKGLEPEPENRIRTAQALMTMFLTVLNSGSFVPPAPPVPPVPPMGYSPSEPPKKGGGGKKAAAIIFSILGAFLLVGAIIIGIILIIYNVNKPDDPIPGDPETTTAEVNADYTYPVYTEPYGETETTEESTTQPETTTQAPQTARPTQPSTTRRQITTTTRPVNTVLSTGSNSMYYGSADSMSYTFRAPYTGEYTFSSNSRSDGYDLKGELWKNGTRLASSDDANGRDFSITQQLNAGDNVTLKVSDFTTGSSSYIYINIGYTETVSAYDVAMDMYNNYRSYGFYMSNEDDTYKFNPSYSSSTATWIDPGKRTPVGYSYSYSDNTLWMKFSANNSNDGDHYVYYPIEIDDSMISHYEDFEYYEDNGINFSTSTTLYIEPDSSSETAYWDESGYEYPETFTVRDGTLWLGFSTNHSTYGDILVWYPV